MYDHINFLQGINEIDTMRQSRVKPKLRNRKDLGKLLEFWLERIVTLLKLG